MKMVLAAFAVAALATAAAHAEPSRASNGFFVKCPRKGYAEPMQCRKAQGKFAKRGTPEAKPV